VIPGTIVRDSSRAAVRPGELATVRIGNPYGVMDVKVRWESLQGEPRILGAAVGRTARRLMEGYAYVPRTRTAP
jgi:2-methylaconitate cis-trans-isomerase PrpF